MRNLSYVREKKRKGFYGLESVEHYVPSTPS